MRGEFLQGAPAFPIQIGRADNMAEQAAPFHERPLNVAVAKRFVGESVTRGGIRDELANHFRCARTVLDRDAHLQITGVIRAPVGLLAKNSEPAAERRVFAGKARARPDVGQVEDKIVDRIRFVLEPRGDRESFAGVEK